MNLKLIITDFDGTLVNTFEANYQAYAEAVTQCDRKLTRDSYRQCFGYRYDDFMRAVGVDDADVRQRIRKIKGEVYPSYFEYLQSNEPLINFIRAFHRGGGKTAIASTARRLNLVNTLRYLHLTELFDCILAGEDVTHGKPNPEIYLKVMERMEVSARQTLIFEDSEVGFEAAEASGVQCVKINQAFYGY